MSAAAEPEARFERLVGAVSGLDGVTLGSGRRGFGSGALHVHGRIFAMLTGRRLVVKLPADRVASLIASGEGVAFDAGKGRPMKEWVALVTDDDDAWQARAREARDFVSRP
jgi:hypothetical protein